MPLLQFFSLRLFSEHCNCCKLHADRPRSGFFFPKPLSALLLAVYLRILSESTPLFFPSLLFAVHNHDTPAAGKVGQGGAKDDDEARSMHECMNARNHVRHLHIARIRAVAINPNINPQLHGSPASSKRRHGPGIAAAIEMEMQMQRSSEEEG